MGEETVIATHPTEERSGSSGAEAPGSGELSGIAEFKVILRLRAFRRLWIVLGFSSIGDWLGILATSTFASSLFSNPAAQGAAFSGAIVVRLIPALVLGPIAGVFADRFDRRRTMVICDSIRFVLYASIPLVGVFASSVVTAAWLAVATFMIETCQMMWAPAKEASVPNLVPKKRLEKANQLAMATTYGATPILAGVVLAFLNWLIGALGFGSSYSVALVLNALTYAATALMVWFGIKEISGHRESRPEKAEEGMFRQFVDGWRYIARFRFARGLVLGIFGAFAAAGVVIGAGRTYAKSLGGGDASFYLLFALLFVGLGIGIGAGPKLVGQLSRRRWFGLSIILATGAVGLLALAPHLFVAAFLTVVVGAGAGMAFLNGITLLGVEIDDAMRGRVYSFIQVSVQGVLLLTLSASSVLVGIGSSRVLHLGPASISISSTRVLLLAAGVVGVFAGVAALKQMDDKRGVPLLADIISSIRGRPLGRPEPHESTGLFVVFEGGEGAGKSTQVIKLAAWLRVHGNEAVVTREPGATEVGARIRGLVLDAGDTTVSPRAEALLYAADRAHHVATVVRPALQRGAVVVSDRYVDSSLAYQGAGRTLPSEEIGWLSDWATGGLKPDLVVLLDIDPNVGLARAAARGAADKLEAESVLFHERVRHAFLDLAERDPARYLVLDATLEPDELAEQVRQRVSRLLKPADADPTPSTTGTTASASTASVSTPTSSGSPLGGGTGSAAGAARGGSASAPIGSGSAVGGGSAAGSSGPAGSAADGTAADEDGTAAAGGDGPGRGGGAEPGTEYGRIAAPGGARPAPGQRSAPRPDATAVLPPSDADPTAVLSRTASAGAGDEPGLAGTPTDPVPTDAAPADGVLADGVPTDGVPAGTPTDDAPDDPAAGAPVAADETTVLPKLDETSVLPRVTGEAGPGASDDATALPAAVDETTVLARVADETSVLPAVDEAAPRRSDEVAPRRSDEVAPRRGDEAAPRRDETPPTGPDGTTVLPVVGEPSDPWRSDETAAFPAVTPGFDPWGRPAEPEPPGYDDETMIMPSRTGDLRRRRPRRKR